MGALESLLATSNASPSPAPAQGGALEKLLAGSDPAGTPTPAPAKPASKGGSDNQLVDDLVGGTADAIDLVWTGLFAAPVAMAGEAITRAQLGANNLLGLGEPKTRRDIGRAGQATAARINESLGTPVRSTLKALGLLSDRKMAVEKAMESAMALIERDAASVEERTGGVIQKEDVLMGVNTLFGALGAKGVQRVAKTVPEQAKAKAALKELAKIREEGNLRNAAADAEALNREAGGIPREPRPNDNPMAGDPNVAAFDQRVNAEQRARELMNSGASIAEVEAAIKKNPAVGQALDDIRKKRESFSAFLQEDPSLPEALGGVADLQRLSEIEGARSRGEWVSPADLEKLFNARVAMQPRGEIKIEPAGSGEVTPTAERIRASLLGRRSEMGPVEAAARDAAAGITRGPLGEPIFSAGPADLGPRTAGRSSRDPRRSPVTGSGLMGVDAPPQPDVFGAAATGGRSVPDPRRPAGPSGLMGLPERPQADSLGAAATGGRASPDPTRPAATGSGLSGLPAKRDSLGTPLSPNQVLGLVGATGLGLAAYYADDKDRGDLAAAAAGGALLLGKGKGITLEAIRALPDTATLREIRDASSTTLNTLENLPGNRAVHSKQAIGELLRRQEVTKAERDIIQGVLDSVPGETITAKQLMAGVKEATGDFELTPRASGQFADYGLTNIGRTDSFGDAPDIDTAIEPQNATTTIYQSPFELGTNNHFSDPNYFAHTRSFYENGVKHVVEMQSDLAQKAGKVLTPEERAKLVLERDAVQGKIEGLLSGPDRLTSLPEVRRLRVVQAEINAKIAAADTPLERVSPMLKRWDRRLVREELADSARRGEPTARFATADTVAKVEGWPRFANERLDDTTPRFSPEHQGIYDRYNKEVTAFLKQLGGKEVTDSAGHTWIEVPTEGTRKMPAGRRVQQFGFADPELLAIIAAVGGAAYVASLVFDDKGKKDLSKAGILASLATFGRSRVHGIAEMARSPVAGAERYLGMVSTRVGDMSPKLLRRMRDHEMGVLTRTNDYLKAIAPFVEGLRKIPEAARANLDAAILTGDIGKITTALGKAGRPELVAEFRKARALLQQVGAELMQRGKLKGLLPDYYPRIVTDVPGLLKALGTEERTLIEAKLEQASRKVMKEALRDLTPLEQSQIINSVLKGGPTGTGKPGFLKKRIVGEVTPELAQFYAPASESLPLYLRAVAKELEKSRFFGENLVRDPVTGAVNLDESIGNVVREERAAGRITPDQAMELGDILKSRFGPGERSGSPLIQSLKNVAYAGLLGHVTSAITQFGDVVTSFAAHGILPTVKAIQQNLTGKPARVTMRDLGMIDHIAEEFVTASRKPVTVFGHQLSTAKFLEKVFKYSGFSLVDKIGKNVSIQASKNKLEGWAKSPAGIKRLEAKYGKAYTPTELQQLTADLRSGELTPLVKSVLFSELSDLQPISKLEVPQAYLDNPNWRALYMLKGFMLKQADIVRREVWKNIRAGNYTKASERAIKFGLALGIGGATTQWINNWLLGRDDEAELSDIPVNTLKTFGWSQYTLDKVKQGKPLEAVVDVAAPPYKMFDKILSADPTAIQYLPIVGRVYYARDWADLLEESGSERHNRLKDAADRRKERAE